MDNYHKSDKINFRGLIYTEIQQEEEKKKTPTLNPVHSSHPALVNTRLAFYLGRGLETRVMRKSFGDGHAILRRARRETG